MLNEIKNRLKNFFILGNLAVFGLKLEPAYIGPNKLAKPKKIHVGTLNHGFGTALTNNSKVRAKSSDSSLVSPIQNKSQNVGKKKQKTEQVSLNFRNIDITQFFKPGIYAIENKVTGERYIGQSSNVLRRLGRHLYKNLCNISAKNLQEAWNKYGAESFEFIILEIGDYLSEEYDRLYYEKRYINLHLDQNKKVYNKLHGKTLIELEEVKQDIFREKETPLKPCNQNIHYLNLPGVYCITNKLTNRKYVGEGNSLIRRFLTNIVSLNAGKYENKSLQADYKKDKLENFTFTVLELGQDFSNKKTRQIYEKNYINQFIPNIYNELFIDFKTGMYQNPDWNKVTIYIKKGNEYTRYSSISAAIQKGLGQEKMRYFLDDQNNTEWYYGRSFARYFSSGRIKLVVFDFTHVYLNAVLTALNHNLSHRKVTHRIADKKDRNCIYLNDMTPEEKDKIPHLKEKVKKVLRLVIPLPLDTSIPLEKEILAEQSPTYPKSIDEDLLCNYSKEYKEKMYNKLEKMVNDIMDL